MRPGLASSRFRRLLAIAAAAGVFVSALSVPRLGAALPRYHSSPRRELVIVTANIRQASDWSLGRLTSFANALRTRPHATDGRLYAPDIVILQEISLSQLKVLRGQLNRLFGTSYGIAGRVYGGDKAKLLVNLATLRVEQAGMWRDVCMRQRRYQWIRVRERASGRRVLAAGVHFYNVYSDDCKLRNAVTLRRTLARHRGPVVVAGDFNRRAMWIARECDQDERSGDMPWWRAMTSWSRVDGRAYTDAVRYWGRRTGASLEDQWSWESPRLGSLCNGLPGLRRTRIDYIFVRKPAGFVKEARVDHPGWAGVAPGVRECALFEPDCQYSDHRFVWARIAF